MIDWKRWYIRRLGGFGLDVPWNAYPGGGSWFDRFLWRRATR